MVYESLTTLPCLIYADLVNPAAHRGDYCQAKNTFFCCITEYCHDVVCIVVSVLLCLYCCDCIVVIVLLCLYCCVCVVPNCISSTYQNVLGYYMDYDLNRRQSQGNDYLQDTV